MKILDVSSPQWFTLYLAAKYLETEFIYINITDDQVKPYKNIAESLGIFNLTYFKGDVRKLDFDTDAFDKVISISVLEHIYPELGGDEEALLEIKRVLKPEGELLVTVPYKAIHNVVYKNGAVYERGENKRNFYAREYDKETFDMLIESCQFAFEKELFICEKKGFLSKDFYQFGPGKSKWFSKYLIKSLNLSERILQHPFDEALAERYLEISENINHRVVNVFALLKKVAA
ncbi:class I SAM-dependent methyltransferase [Lunatibacter salilacus]|uniref:class I SAM-dependent methyltransferase n=1 Tax=Lunatibacter salilacus TaxID=2483804 RepID=UPI00131ADAC7|nr:class I SAM-dependent methyltransferase [Lunatibacter salilacus]